MRLIEYENLAKLNAPFEDAFRTQFEAVLQSGWYILGHQVQQFEQAFARYCQAEHCVGVANGLEALVLALKAYEFPAGSEVIVPSNTYVATVLAVLQAGLHPVLAPPDMATYNLDPQALPQYISPRTVALMPVHLYGKPCDMPALLSIAQAYGLKVIEDAAQAHGASISGQKVGSFGDMTCFSFYPTKNLGALGDGGAITTNDAALAERLRTLRNYGSQQKYYNQLLGHNSRLDELQAAFLAVKLPELDRINAHKQALAARYLEGLKAEFIKPVLQEGYTDVFHIFAVRHPERDRLRQYLLDRGIKTEIHYPLPPFRQEALQGYFDPEAHPLADTIHRTILSLPCSFAHHPEEIEQVIEVMNAF
jgi:dTDP-4-amino-4,6-dideoxygalactose transaminase